MKVATIFTVLATSVFADAPVVEHVETTVLDAGGWRFDVTLSHPDTGWDHYADGWDILDNHQKLIATRILHHPHVDEQPFTRSLYNVVIPSTMKTIYVRGHDKVHGHGEVYKVELK